MQHCKGCIHIGRSSVTLNYVIYIPQNTGILVFCIWLTVYWLVVISRRQRVIMYLVPWLYFYSSCKKKKYCLYPSFIFLWSRFKHTANEHDCAVFDLWRQRCTFILGYNFILVWFICSCWSCCQAFLWLTDFSKVALICLWCWSHFEAKNRNPIFIPAPLLEALICFNMALHLKDLCFLISLSPFKT